MFKYKIADVVFTAELNYEYVKRVCKDYEYDGDEEPAFHAAITQADIDFEKSKSEDVFPDPYFESLALFRKLCNYALKEVDGIIFHSSAIMVDGKAYLFTAPSGTGKSTHARLWREMLGDRAVMINDDKPIIRYIDGKFYVYGTPWNGKHGLGTNARAEIKAICKIYQAKENVIKKATAGEMLMTVLNQTLRPEDESDMDKLLTLIDKMLRQVGIYVLGCNISKEAAETSFNYMSKENENEN